jgi:branched-chain amino acid transport system substrate-binding protein
MPPLNPPGRPVRAIAAAATAMVAGLGAGCGVLADSPPPPVVIATDLALTGSGADLGATFRQALELRVEQVNQQRLLGERRLRLVVRDNRSTLAGAAANLAELAADPQVTAIVAGGCAACIVEAAGDLDAARVPTISLAPGDAVVTPVAQRRYLFQLAPNASDNADVLAAEIARAGSRTVALVTVDGLGYGTDGARELSAAAAAADLELVLHERIPDGEGGGDDAVAALAARVAGWRPAPLLDSPPGAADVVGPEAVVLWTPPGQAYRLAEELRRAGWRGRLFLDALAAGPLFVSADAGGGALAGAHLVFTETLAVDQVVAATPAKVARQAWWRDYLTRYGGYDAYASFAADAVGVVVAAVNRMDTTDRERLRDTIEATTLDGLSGPIRFTPDNHSGLQPLALTVLVATGDRWRLAS